MLFAARLELAAGLRRGGMTCTRRGERSSARPSASRSTEYYDLDLATNELGAGVDAILRTGGLAVLVEGRMESLAPADTSVDVPVSRRGRREPGRSPRSAARSATGSRLFVDPWFDDATALEDNGDTASSRGVHVARSYGCAAASALGTWRRLELAGAALDNDTARLWLQLAL